MIALRGKVIAFNDAAMSAGSATIRLSTDVRRPMALRRGEGFICNGSDVPDGFGWYLLRQSDQSKAPPVASAQVVLTPEFEYLADGDVVHLEPSRGALRALFRKSAPYNHFLLTERCNNYCLMCSQPPRAVDDGWIVDEILAALPLIDREASEIGFTGGEPTLLGPRFIELVRAAASHLPRTALHILSNGRNFKDESLARDLAQVLHHDLMMGIPVYADLAHIHDHVVQADGAFDETIRGILNLKRHGIRVEIRVVLQLQTIPRLVDLARFITRNLLFVDHVALMGLELTGFARANLEQIWIDPIDYQQELVEAVGILDRVGIRTSIYNSQLCVLDARLRRFSRRSISDWKQQFMPECDGCTLQSDCGGFFASASIRHSRGIRAMVDQPA